MKPRDKNGRFIKGVLYYKVPKGTHNSPATEFKKGHIMSDEVRNKISETLKGKSTAWLTGRKLSQKTRKKMSQARIGKNYNIKRKTGSEHWNWKGGVTSQNERIRKSPKWKKWRELIFSRDNYTCQNITCPYCSNKKGVLLHPHHIKWVSTHPKLAYDIDNGVTYCEKYHIKMAHKKQIAGETQ